MEHDKSGKVAAALLEIAADMREGGLIDSAHHAGIKAKRTMRGKTLEALVQPLTGEQIRALREEANMSQSMFARYLNVTAASFA